MQFNFNFEAFEQSGKEKNEAINYLKSLNSSIDFDKLEQENKGDENAIYEALKGGNFSFSKPSIEDTRQKLLKNKENEALKAEFNAGLSWLGEEKRQDFNFYDFKKAKEKANSKLGLIQADLKAQEKELKRKEALFETRLKERGIIAKSFDDMLDQSGAYLGADLLEKGLNKLGFKDENYIFESEKEDIKSRALKSVREKLERGDLEFNEREKHALRSKYDEPDYKKALEKEKERLRLSQKSGNFNEAEREFIENDLGFFNTLFNDDKENIKEFKEKVKSEGVISSEIIKAANTLKAFDEGNLFKNMLFADEKEKKEFQQNFLNDAYKIAELSGFDDVGLDKKGELYFIKDEQKYLVNTGFFDNFAQLLNDTKFEFAGGVLGGLKGFNSGKSAKGKVAKSILGAAAGSFGGAFLDAKIADMYLNRESDFKKNLDFAIQAGLLSMAGDGVILSVKPLAKGLYKGVKKGGEILGEYSILGTLKTLPQQNIQAAEKIINEVFSPKMKEELKAAQEEFGGSVRGEDLKNAFFANLQKKFTQKYGENDSKTKSVAKIAEIFNTNSLKTRQQAMLDLVRSDTHGSTLAYLLEIAKDDVKIQNNLKNMLNLASSNVEKNLKNLNINAREIKHILDEFEAGNKAAFKEVESQISKLYDENYRVVLSKGEYENIKEEFRQNGVNLEEMTPFLRDLEANVFNENGVTFTQLNNFRKNLNFYIFNKDKTPNFINTLKKIGENILKNEIDKGIDNIFSQNKAAYESIKELYSTSLKDYATLKSLNESIKNLKLQDSAKSADEVLNSLIKYAKGQGEKGVNNLQKIKDYLGEENNAFLEMQILNKLFKESVVENDRASLRVFDSESFLGRVRELVGDTPAPLGANLEARALSGASQGPSKQENFIKKALNKDEAKLFLENLNGAKIPKKLDIEGFLKELESVENKENFISHLSKKEDAQSRLAYLNLVEPTLKEADLILHNGKRQDYIKKFNDGKDFFTLLITEENGKRLITFLPKTREDFIKNKIDNASLIQSFTSRASKQGNGLASESITQPLFKSKEAREFLELVEGFHKLYKNDASIAKNLVQGTASQLSTSIATSAEGAIKQKVVKGGFDPIFRLLPDKILFGLFAKQIQGGALRYHLKKALSRSLNYDDFKIKLEKELKRTNFNSNTSRLIDEFMQNLEDFNREKEQFLEAKRIEQARIKEEERKRAEEIYQAQEANNLKDILEAEEKPLKDEFGVNFEGFKGKEAVDKLLSEKRGQVRGAFYKEGLGEIDLVWGDKNYGLEHILNKHGGEFKNLARELSEAVENGKIVKDDKGRLRLEYENKIVGIKDNWKGEKTAHWVVTAYVKKEKEASLYTSASFTKGEALPLNSNESIAQKALNLHEKLYLKDNDTPLNVEYKIVNKDDIKPTFTLSKTQFRSQKQEDLIKKIKENFNPDLLVNIRGDLKKGNPIITKEGEVISGNHRAAALKELEGENLAKYQNAVKEAFGVELKENEMLVRVADTSEAEIRRFSAASNEGLENNLGEQGVSLFAKYQDKIKALKEAKKPFVADDVYNLKYLVNKALGESSITKENDTSKALFASLARGRNNTILKALNELEKENLEQVSKVANMFFDNAGAFYNLTHDLDLPKMQNLQNYFSDVLVSAAKADFTRAEDFARLNEDIRAFLDSGDKNAMLKLSPNLVSDLLAKAMGAGFARFARLENPSASLYEFLNGLKKDLLEKGAPDLFSGGKGIKLNERDEFDFAKELILKGQDSEEKFRLYQNLEELKAWSGEQKNTKLNTALKALDEVDESKLSEDQKELLRLFKGEIKSVKIQIKDLKDIYTLNQGSRKEGAKKILIKHYGEEKTGGLSSDELLSLKEVIKKGKINLNSLEIKDDFLRYGYDYEKDGVKLRVVIDEFKDGKKVFDYYSDRNFNHYEQGGYKPDLPTPSEIIPQNAKTSPYPQNADEAVRLETISKQELEQSNPQQSHLSTDESIAQNSEKLPFETQTLDEDKLSGDEVRHLANKIGEKSTMAYFKDYLLKMDKNFHARAKDIIREYYKIEPFRKELEKSMGKCEAAYKNGEMSLKEFKFLSRYKDEKSFLNQVAGVLWLQNDELVKNRGYTINKYGLTEQGKGDNYYQNLALEYGKAQTALKKWFYYIQKANKQAQRFFNKKELEDLRANEKGTKLEAKGSEDIIFTDKKGKEHTLTKETQKAWLEAFGLKSLEDSYIPNHNEAIKQALEGKEIKLQLGSLKKLVAQGREKYIPQIKEVLDRPEAIMRDDMGEYLFIKHLKDDDYFVNVSFDNGEYLVSISNGIKETRNLNNKLKKGGEFIYQSPNFNFISQKLLQTSQYSANKIDEDIIAQKAKSERAEFESFKDKIKELYTKYEGLNPYDKSESQLKSKLLNEEIKPEIKKEFKSIIDKFKGADNKDKILRVIKENKEELSDYLAFNIALRKDICIDGHGEGKVDFYDKSIRDFIKLRENKRWSEIDESKYRALVALENLSNKNTSLYFSFKDLNGKVGEIKTYPRIQDLLFYDLILGYDLKNAVILSTKDKHLKEKLIEKLKAYIDKKIYADFLEYKIKDLESRNPKNSHFENYKDEKWDEEALKSLQKELEDLRAKEKGTKLEAKGSEDIIFTDKKGKEHTLTKETQKAWLEAFNLKSLDEEAIVEIPVDLKERLGKEIKLNKKDFEKLVKNKREKYIPQIKETFKEPEAVFIDENDDLIFAKSFNDKLFFVNVNRDYGEAFKALSLAPKKNNNLLNKLDKSKEILKLDSKLRDYTAQQAFTGVLSASNKSSSESIPQKPQQKALNLQEIEQSLKARKSQINDEISANDKAFKENLKEVSKVKPILEALKKEWEALEPTIVTWTHTDYSKAKPKKYYKRKPNLSNLWHIEETLDVYKGYARESDRHANQVAREIALLEKYVKLLKDKEAEVKAFKAKAEADENALILESRIIPIYNQLREAFKKGHHTTKQILEANNIKQDSVQAKEVIDSIAQTRQYLEDTFNIKPLEEFGTNYAEFYRDGKGAVEKLLAEKQGQVSGAFYKEGLGEIDLVWGDEKIGLKKIIEKHLSDFENFEGKDEAEKMVNALNEIIENGKIITENGINTLWLKKDDEYYLIGLSRGWSGKGENEWIITSYKKTKGKIPDELKGDTANLSAYSDEFNPLLTSKDEPLNSKDIIPQQKIKFAMEKFHYDEKKAKDLLEWHKNSHALTKDENGLPKVFYHGTYSKFRVFRRVGKASGQGFFFTPSQKAAEEYGDITLNTFLNIKNPFRADELKINKEADLQKWADILKLDYDKEKYESFKDLKTKLEKVKEATKKAGFKFHSASGGGVYVIDNKGRNSFINLEELDKENKRVVEAFKGLETEDIYFYYVVRNEFDLVLYALNKNDRYFHTSGRDEVKRVLEKLGYDGVVLNDTIITVFNSNQIKHIDNKGSFTDTKGNVTSKKPKDKEAEFSYFNEKSDNIYHSNPHLGAGLVGGTLNGVEQDENGNLSFDPVKFAMGFLGGSVGSFALKKGFQILEKNPELKEKIITELADTLAQGFEKAREKYSLLNLLEPRYIVKNEKGRKIQAKTMLKELEREQNKNLQNIIRQNLQNLPLNNKPLELSEKQVKLLINRFANARNLKEHLNTRADNRKELYALLNDTLENPQIHFIKEGRDKYVKRYKGDVNEPYFYLLITQDKDKIFITHLKTRDIKYLSRQISNAEQIKKGADIIEALSQRAGDDKASASKKDYSK
ncbi:PBECR2 nuclease fold domain-containing protein [Campylobacter upsaliensis]